MSSSHIGARGPRTSGIPEEKQTKSPSGPDPIIKKLEPMKTYFSNLITAGKFQPSNPIYVIFDKDINQFKKTLSDNPALQESTTIAESIKQIESCVTEIIKKNPYPSQPLLNLQDDLRQLQGAFTRSEAKTTQKTKQAAAAPVTTVGKDQFKTSFNSITINLQKYGDDGILDTDSHRVAIDKFFHALTGKTFDDNKASDFDRHVYDALLISEGFGQLDESELDERMQNLAKLGPKNACTTLFAATLLLVIQLQNPTLSAQDRQDLETSAQFFQSQLHELLTKNPTLLHSINDRELSLSDRDIGSTESQIRLTEVKAEHPEEIQTKKERYFALFCLALLGGQTAAFIMPALARAPQQPVEMPANFCEGPDPLFCEGNLGIPRNQMPQLSPEVGVDFQKFWESKNVTVSHHEIPVRGLVPTQNELSAVKIHTMVRDANTGKFNPCQSPVYIARTGHVLDGHHRWAACNILKSNIAVVRIDVSIMDLVTQALAFQGVEIHSLHEFKS